MSVLKRVIGGGLEGLGRGMMADAQARGQAAREAYLRAHQTQLAQMEIDARAAEGRLGRQHDANMADKRYDFEGGQRKLDRDLQREIAAGRMTEEQAQRAAAERAARGEDYRRRSGTVDELGVETTDQHRVDALNRGYEFYDRDPEKWEVDFYLNSSEQPENRRWPQEVTMTWEELYGRADQAGVSVEQARDTFRGMGVQVPDGSPPQRRDDGTQPADVQAEPGGTRTGAQTYEPAMESLGRLVDERTADVRARRNTGGGTGGAVINRVREVIDRGNQAFPSGGAVPQGAADSLSYGETGGAVSPRPGGGSLIERLNQAIGDRPLTVVPQSAADNLSEGETGGTVQPTAAPDTETTERVRQAVTPAGERLGRGTAGVGGQAGRQADPRGARGGAMERLVPAQEATRPQVAEAVDRIAQQANPTWETIAQSIIDAGGNAEDLMDTLRVLTERGIPLPSGQMADNTLEMLISGRIPGRGAR